MARDGAGGDAPRAATTGKPPGLSSAVGAVLARATADDPSERFADARELAEILHESIVVPETTVAVTIREEETRNPYKGLRPFSEADAADFFGRDALIRRLVGRMAEDGTSAGFLAVVGPSGSGKSSVVRAGLLPALVPRGGRLRALVLHHVFPAAGHWRSSRPHWRRWPSTTDLPHRRVGTG